MIGSNIALSFSHIHPMYFKFDFGMTELRHCNQCCARKCIHVNWQSSAHNDIDATILLIEGPTGGSLAQVMRGKNSESWVSKFHTPESQNGNTTESDTVIAHVWTTLKKLNDWAINSWRERVWPKSCGRSIEHDSSTLCVLQYLLTLSKSLMLP